MIFFFILVSIFTAIVISFKVEAPVDSKIFLFCLLINFNKGRLVISPDGILMKSIWFFSKNFKFSISNAVDKNFIFFFLQ